MHKMKDIKSKPKRVWNRQLSLRFESAKNGTKLKELSLSEKTDFAELNKAGLKGHEIAWTIGNKPTTIHVVLNRFRGVLKQNQVLERPNLLSIFVQL